MYRTTLVLYLFRKLLENFRQLANSDNLEIRKFIVSNINMN